MQEYTLDNNTQTPQPNHEQSVCPECHGAGVALAPLKGWPVRNYAAQYEPLVRAKMGEARKPDDEDCPTCHGSGQLPEPDLYSTKPLLDKSIQPDTTSIICGHCGRRYRLADGHSCKERYQPKTSVKEASGHGVNGLVGQPDYTSAGEFEQQIENELMDLQRISFYDEGLADTTVKGAVAAILAAHNQAIRAELQALASSNNWRVQLESRMAALDKDKEIE